MLSQINNHFVPLKLIVAKPFLSWNPNILTLIGTGCSVLFFLSVVNGLYLVAFLMLLLSSFDAIDGTVARQTGRVSAFGAFFDSTLDRVADFLMLASFGYAGLVRWEILVPLLFISMLISYTRTRAEHASGGKKVFAIGIIERTERLACIGVGILVLLFGVNMNFGGFSLLELLFLVLLFFSTITSLQRINAAYKELS